MCYCCKSGRYVSYKGGWYVTVVRVGGMLATRLGGVLLLQEWLLSQLWMVCYCSEIG